MRLLALVACLLFVSAAKYAWQAYVAAGAMDPGKWIGMAMIFTGLIGFLLLILQ